MGVVAAIIAAQTYADEHPSLSRNERLILALITGTVMVVLVLALEVTTFVVVGNLLT